MAEFIESVILVLIGAGLIFFPLEYRRHQESKDKQKQRRNDAIENHILPYLGMLADWLKTTYNLLRTTDTLDDFDTNFNISSKIKLNEEITTLSKSYCSCVYRFIFDKRFTG